MIAIASSQRSFSRLCRARMSHWQYQVHSVHCSNAWCCTNVYCWVLPVDRFMQLQERCYLADSLVQAGTLPLLLVALLQTDAAAV